MYMYTYVCLTVGIHAFIFLGPDPTSVLTDRPHTYFRHRQVLMRSDRLRANGGHIRPQAFQARKEYFVAKDTGALHEQVCGWIRIGGLMRAYGTKGSAR